MSLTHNMFLSYLLLLPQLRHMLKLKQMKIFKLVTNESVASVNRKLDQKTSAASRINDVSRSTLTANLTAAKANCWKDSRISQKSRPKSSQKIFLDAFCDFKVQAVYTRCDKYGHWTVDHATDGLFRDNLPSNDFHIYSLILLVFNLESALSGLVMPTLAKLLSYSSTQLVLIATPIMKMRCLLSQIYRPRAMLSNRW